MINNEIVIYQNKELSTNIEVKVEDNTVWLTQAQMITLFGSTKQNISLHINNVFKEGELEKDSTVKYSLTTAKDGKNYKIKFYNLDVIISVGYRVKSQRGTQFRIWATQVLRSFLLKGYAIHQRLERIENKISEHDKVFDLLINTTELPREGVFYDGQIFDAYKFVIDIINSAEKSIVLIDNYIDESVLVMLSKRSDNVKTIIYTDKISKQLELDIQKFNNQYQPIELKKYKKSHDRFLIIDNEEIYHIGASLKDLGKKLFAFSKMDINIRKLLLRLETNE